jgi:hypothetical protein
LCPPQSDTVVTVVERIVEVHTPADTVNIETPVTIIDSICYVKPVHYENQYVKIGACIENEHLMLDVFIKPQKLYITVTDTIKRIKDVYILKERYQELTWWQRTKIRMGEYLIAVILAFFIAVFAWIALRRT